MYIGPLFKKNTCTPNCKPYILKKVQVRLLKKAMYILKENIYTSYIRHRHLISRHEHLITKTSTSFDTQLYFLEESHVFNSILTIEHLYIRKTTIYLLKFLTFTAMESTYWESQNGKMPDQIHLNLYIRYTQLYKQKLYWSKLLNLTIF